MLAAFAPTAILGPTEGERDASQLTHILLVEDDPAVAQGLRTGLEREGYAMAWKANGSDGLEHARDHSPHLIILDVRLPDTSGSDVCRQMRRLGLRQPILMLTVPGIGYGLAE